MLNIDLKKKYKRTKKYKKKKKLKAKDLIYENNYIKLRTYDETLSHLNLQLSPFQYKQK